MQYQSLTNGTMEALLRVFDLAEEKKRKYETSNSTDKIRWGRGNVNQVTGEFFKIASHPQFHCPTDPDDLRCIQQVLLNRRKCLDYFEIEVPISI